MVGVAVKVTLVPEHIVMPGLAVMLTLAGRADETVIVMLFDVAGLPDGQVTELVSTQVITSKLASVDEV